MQKHKQQKNQQKNSQNTDLPIPEPILTVRRNVVNTSTTPPTGTLIIIDNFYNNPMQTRESVLKQEFKVFGCKHSNFPGVRTLSFATKELKEIIQQYVYPFGGKITMFPTEKNDKNYNGAFQITSCRDRSWFHVDSWNNWAGVLYLTPNAPVNGGTGLYRFEDGTRFDFEQKIRKNEDAINNSITDFNKWELVDKVGNIFNRLVLFNAHHFHSSMDYFGHNLETGRLFQVFFFSTENDPLAEEARKMGVSIH